MAAAQQLGMQTPRAVAAQPQPGATVQSHDAEEEDDNVFYPSAALRGRAAGPDATEAATATRPAQRNAALRRLRHAGHYASPGGSDAFHSQ